MKKLSIKFYRYLQAQKHIASTVVKNIEFCHYFAKIVPADGAVILLAVLQQQLCIFNLIVKAVKIDAGIHTAVDNDGSLQSRLIPITDKNKRILRNKVSVDEILFFIDVPTLYECACKNPRSISALRRTTSSCSKARKPSS